MSSTRRLASESAARGEVRQMQKRAAIGKGRRRQSKAQTHNVLDPPIGKGKRRQRRGETYAKSAQRLAREGADRAKRLWYNKSIYSKSSARRAYVVQLRRRDAKLL